MSTMDVDDLLVPWSVVTLEKTNDAGGGDVKMVPMMMTDADDGTVPLLSVPELN